MKELNRVDKVTILCHGAACGCDKTFFTQETLESVLNRLHDLSVAPLCISPDSFLCRDEETDRISRHLFVWDKARFRRVCIADIIYIEADRSYSTIHIRGSKDITLSVPMCSAVRYLDERSFVKVHRSSIVNLDYVDYLTGNTLTMCNGDSVSIGREYRGTVLNRMNFLGTKSKKYVPAQPGK